MRARTTDGAEMLWTILTWVTVVGWLLIGLWLTTGLWRMLKEDKDHDADD